MRITRNRSGVIKVDDKPLDMYDFSGWLIQQGNRTGQRVGPSQASDRLIARYLRSKEEQKHGC